MMYTSRNERVWLYTMNPKFICGDFEDVRFGVLWSRAMFRVSIWKWHLKIYRAS